jgi:multidrug efflux pump
MMISDISVKRPVLALVASLLIIVFGAIAFFGLPLRELPDVDPPVVSVNVGYRGASAEVMETTVTQVIENQLAGIEGIDLIESQSRDGRSSITITFLLSRDIEAAANDVRNAVSRITGQLPVGADAPEVFKTDADADPIIWFNMDSTTLSRVELTDYAERFVVDRLSVLPGVATVRVGGGQRPSMRVWLDPEALAARGLTVDDVDAALRSQNIELPGGYLQGTQRDYTVRVTRGFETVEQFQRLPVGRSAAGHQIRLGEVARVEVAAEETRRLFRGNGVDQIGLGIVRQSRSNAIEVGDAVKAEIERIRPTLPEGTDIIVAFDSTVFISEAVDKVWQTLIEAVILVVLVIFLFLGSFRAALVPAAVIPVCLLGAFAIIALFGFSINLLTLLALVLSIGLVVDDSIVVLENVQRRLDEGEPVPVASIRGTREIAFAVIATSSVLVAVFVPLLFVGGYIGRLFIELAVVVAGVIAVSAFCSLTLTPMMCSLLLRPAGGASPLARFTERMVLGLRRSYRGSLELVLRLRWATVLVFLVVAGGGWWLLQQLPGELVPEEDRGNASIIMTAPEGASFEVSLDIMLQAEAKLQAYVERGEVTRFLIVVPSFQDIGTNRFNRGFGRVFMAPWDERERSGQEIVAEMNRDLATIPGAVFRAVMPGPIQQGGGGAGDNVSIIIAGGTYGEIAGIAERVVDRVRDNPLLLRPRSNYDPSSPRVVVDIDRERAAALGVSTQAIGRTLEALMGSRRVTTFQDRGEEFDVIIQAERTQREGLVDLESVQVRSDRTGQLIPLSNLVSLRTVGDEAGRNRVNRMRAVAVQASLAPGATLGEGLAVLEAAAQAEIAGTSAKIDYTGAAKQFRDAAGGILFAFLAALLIVYLVLAAQFESFVHPLTIMLTVPIAVAGGLFGLYAFDASLNIYSQIGLIILIGLAAKNGILIVEFANQLRDRGMAGRAAILEASELRLRPILMTSIATVVGAIPLITSTGAGAESREAIGVVVVFGVSFATALTLFVVPVLYDLLVRFSGSPEARAQAIEAWEAGERDGPGTRQPAE